MALKVSIINMFLNIFLSVMKLAAGIMAHSDALVSDAVHSASDVFATLVVILGIFFSGKEADKEHPYGHERLECIAAMFLGGIIFLTGVGIGGEGIKKVADFYYGVQIETPGMAALIVADGSISLENAHKIAENVHLAMEEKFPGVKHCMVHMEPCHISLDK